MNITILGAGAWGTALAIHFAQHQHNIHLWTYEREHADALCKDRENKAFLPNFRLPENISIFADFADAVHNTELVLIVTPVIGLRNCAQLLKQHQATHLPILTACKGFELESGLLPFQVLQEELPENQKIGVLSGPSFAEEVAQQRPCAVALASNNNAWAESLTRQLNTNTLRLYANNDVMGVSIGGAVKNVMAIATGLSDGLNYGLNARAALITRGLTEITRLAVAMGAQPKTMMGLAGMGDLILTCTGALSRNRKVGLALAENKNLAQILEELGHVAEGVPTITEVHKIAAQHQIEMPIVNALYQLVHNKIAAQDVMQQLMQRQPTSE